MLLSFANDKCMLFGTARSTFSALIESAWVDHESINKMITKALFTVSSFLLPSKLPNKLSNKLHNNNCLNYIRIPYLLCKQTIIAILPSALAAPLQTKRSFSVLALLWDNNE